MKLPELDVEFRFFKRRALNKNKTESKALFFMSKQIKILLWPEIEHRQKPSTKKL